jgi:hypothetical protein
VVCTLSACVIGINMRHISPHQGPVKLKIHTPNLLVTYERCLKILNCVNSGNSLYHSVQSFLRSRLLNNNLDIKMYKTIISPVFFVCETLTHTKRKKEIEGV